MWVSVTGKNKSERGREEGLGFVSVIRNEEKKRDPAGVTGKRRVVGGLSTFWLFGLRGEVRVF